ncbi:MAG: isochorismatase family protein [Candidatus Woesearchaeota archaeon]
MEPNSNVTNPTIAVYETDVQHDFGYRVGALFVHANKPWQMAPYGAEEKLPQIIKIHDYAVKNNWQILGSVDRHFYEDVELIRNAGGVFEDHCMNGTLGQLRISPLEPQKDVYIRCKDGPLQGIRIYSPQELKTIVDSRMQIIFEKQSYDVGTNPNFEPTLRMLAEKGIKKVVQNGFATDYCNLAALLKMAQCNVQYDLGLQLYIVTDAIEEVDIDFTGKIDPDFGKKALDKMVNAGARLITTNEILEGRI